MPTNNAKGLEEVMGLLGKASPGPWTIGITETDTGEIEVLSEGRPYVCMVLPGAIDETTRANAQAITAAVNYLRSHGAAIAELIEAAKGATEEKMHDGASSRAACDRLEAALRQVEGQ